MPRVPRVPRVPRLPRFARSSAERLREAARLGPGAAAAQLRPCPSLAAGVGGVRGAGGGRWEVGGFRWFGLVSSGVRWLGFVVSGGAYFFPGHNLWRAHRSGGRMSVKVLWGCLNKGASCGVWTDAIRVRGDTAKLLPVWNPEYKRYFCRIWILGEVKDSSQ